MKRLAAIAATTLAVVVPATGAFAAWSASISTGSGRSAATAILAISGGPSATVIGSTVRVAFNSVTLKGAALGSYTGGGYRVSAYPSAAGGASAGTVTCAASPCDVTGLGAGTWFFDVTPKLQNWSGATTSRVSATLTSPLTVDSFAGFGGGNTKVVASGKASTSGTGLHVYFCTTSPCTPGTAVADNGLGAPPVQSNGTWTYTSGNLGSGTYYVLAQQTVSGTLLSATIGNTVTR